MRLLIPLALLSVLIARPASAQWTRVDTNYGLPAPYDTDLLGADATNVYAIVLAQATTPAAWTVLRSADDGDTWSAVRTIPVGGTSVEAAFLGDLDGLLVAAIPTAVGTVTHLSNDQGTTWSVATPVPSQLVQTFARDGDVLLATGFASFRSPDRGTTWQPISGGQTNQTFNRVVRAGGDFWARNSLGSLYRLPDAATTWERVATAPLNMTGLWLDGGTFWTVGRASFIAPLSLFSSADGVTWTARPTAQPGAYADAYPVPPGDSPWFLTTDATIEIASHFLSADDGASLTDITAGYPRSANGFACVSVYTVTATAAFGATTGGLAGSAGCAPGVDPDAGVYRYTFGGPTAAEGGAPGAPSLALAVAGNPVRDGSTVRLTLSETSTITADLHDALGRRVARLADGTLPAGETILALPTGLAPGIYVVRARAGDQTASRMLTVVR